jgi:hypothetical protein
MSILSIYRFISDVLPTPQSRIVPQKRIAAGCAYLALESHIQRSDSVRRARNALIFVWLLTFWKKVHHIAGHLVSR